MSVSAFLHYTEPTMCNHNTEFIRLHIV